MNQPTPLAEVRQYGDLNSGTLAWLLRQRNREADMSKTAEVAPAMTALRAKLNARAEALLARIAKTSDAGAAAYDLADNHLDAHEIELKAMESELRQLSNLPPPTEQSAAPFRGDGKA